MNAIEQEIQRHANPEKAKILQLFFKTGKGEYGEGDVFLGITVPEQRKIAKNFSNSELEEIEELLESEIHEKRMTALLILVEKFEKSENEEKRKIFDFYLGHTNYINNWDLVDLSAPKICGAFLQNQNRKILYTLAVSQSLWERRIAIISCFAFIKKNDFKDALKISEMLLQDEQDLIQKAVGWMLREIGKRNPKTEEEFLKKHYKRMPRTMLRYAIERFPEKKRKAFLQGTA
jgi:3-methyladenine DNA glycosylase AlkD